MAFNGTFQITDGVTTVDLSGSNVSASGAILEYTPQPYRGEQDSQGLGYVSEMARIRMRGTSASAAFDVIRNAERLFDQARRFAESERGSRVYLRFSPGSAETLHRAELAGGDAIYDRRDGLGWQLNARMFAVDLSWRRRVWEADSEIELPLTNGSAANQTGGLTVYNHYDATATHQNYVEIAASSVGGVEPAPCRVEITNLSATTISTLVLGANAFSASMPIHFLEGESASNATTVADANSSSGNYGRVSISASTAASVLGWNIPAASANSLAGQYYHLWLRIPGAASTNNGIYCYAAAQYINTAQILAQTIEVRQSASGLQSLGALQLPPFLQSESDYLGFDIRLYARNATAINMYCDYLALFGVDNFVVYSSSTGMGQNVTLKDERSVSGRVWVDGVSGTARTAHFIAQGAPLVIYPNRLQRLHFLAMDSTNLSIISNTFRIRVYYRPRRWTL